ncbi:hypothetical protein [Glycomyces salinus]|uniref:hypothetical protein n=1 Tax=Glycomyces salinus TaxID=980294 RepID=UPI0018ECAEE4|nr:hypothetical protein [Glycomyces salinus]
MPDPGIPRSRRESARLGWVVLFSLLSLVPIAVWNGVDEPDSPSELVAAFLEAVSEGEVDRALSYTDASVPTGEAAAFLHPDAIDGGWDVLEVTEREGRYSSETDVTATIGRDGGTAVGHFTVREGFDEELVLSDPLVKVAVTPGSQLSVRIGERVDDRTSTDMLTTLVGQPWTYELLPGVYRFYGGEPTAVLEAHADGEAITVSPPAPEPTPEQAMAVQTRVNELIDRCLEYRLQAPPGCPFSTDGYVDTPEGQRLEELEDIEWTLVEYPLAAVVEADPELVGQNLLQLRFTEPGRLELHGTGTEDRDEWIEFTTPCRFVGSELLVVLSGDDEVGLAPLGTPETDSCRGTA